jgi:hypothetical protein
MYIQNLLATGSPWPLVIKNQLNKLRVKVATSTGLVLNVIGAGFGFGGTG